MKTNCRKQCRALIKVTVLTTTFYFLLIINTIGWQWTASEEDLQRNRLVRTTSHDIPSQSSTKPLLFDNFVHALTARADADRYVILTMIDQTFTDMAINFYEASLRTHHVDNFLFVGVGRKACEILTNMSIACFYYAEDPGAGRASSYGQAEFRRKMNIRTDMILEALAANFTVIHTDTDIAFLGNPVTHVKEMTNSTDVAPMWDTVCYNAGFIVLRPTPLAIQLYLIIRKMTQESKLDDQQALNRAIRILRSQNATFRMKVLNRNSFLSGCAYFETSGRLLPKPSSCNPLRTPNCPIVVHNNWIVSKNAKVYRFREHLMWLYDGENQYYSSKTRKYLKYTNSNSSKASAAGQLEDLKTALAIGHLLNRSVILPTFLCGNAKPCPLNSLIRISSLDSSFKDGFRESSFLKHPKVPDVVKRSLYDGEAALRRNSTSYIRITSGGLQQLFAHVTAKVLNVGNLFGVHIVFDDKSEGTMFDQKVQKGIRKASYRQY